MYFNLKTQIVHFVNWSMFDVSCEEYTGHSAPLLYHMLYDALDVEYS